MIVNIFIAFLLNYATLNYKMQNMINSPSFLQATHCATFCAAESSIVAVEASASQTGVEDNTSQPSATLFIFPQILQ